MAASLSFQRDQAYDKLLELIVAGRIAPGQPISERQIAAELGFGRTPVREAMRSLAQHGLLDVQPARGTFVASITEEQLRELYEVRFALEGEAAELAARHGATPELLQFAARLSTSRRSKAERALRDTYETGANFHVAVFRCAGNSILLDLYMPIRNRFRTTMQLGRFYDKQWVIDGIEQHLEILDAIVRRDAPLARRRMVRHLKQSYASKKRILKELRASVPQESGVSDPR